MSKRPLLTIFFTVFIDLLGFGIVLPLLPRYAERLQASDFTIGMLMASFSAMQFFFSPLWGRVSDRIGRRPIILLGLFGSVIFYALFGYGSAAGSLVLMFVARIGAGIAGATIATAQAYIADSTPPEKRTSGLALIGMAFGIGFVFGPLLGSLALRIPHSEAAILNPYPGYFAALLSLGALLLAAFELPESLKAGDRVGGHHWFSVDQFKRALSLPTIGALILVGFVAVFAFSEFESTLARFSEDKFGMGDDQNFYLFAYTGLSLMFAQGFVVRRLNKVITDEQMAFAGTLLLLTTMLVLVVALRQESMTLLMILLPVMVTGFGMQTTSVQSLISRRTPADEQGGILGANQASSSMARILGPSFGNVLYGYAIVAPFLFASALLVVVVGLLVRLPKVEDQHMATEDVSIPADTV